MSLLPIVYNCYEQGLGLCIIVNQKLFYADSNLPNAVELEERSWTDDDRNKLKETFTSFGAECQVFNDLTREELLDKLDDAQQKANNPRYSWVVVWVLSHQRRLQGMDQVFGCNGVGVDRNGIINTFTDTTNCPNMSGKPKLFFFEASPQPPIQTEISITETASSPIHGSDYMVTSFAPCHTNSGENTSYIQRVCSLLTSQGEEADLTDILSLTQAVQCINTMKKKIVLKQPRNSSTDSDIEHDSYSPKADNDCTNYTSNTSNSMIHVSPATEELYASGPGLCIIINQELFYADYNIPDATLVDERQATNNDKDNLKKTFGQFGAEFVIFQDLTREELEDRLEAAAVKADSPQYC